MKKLKHKVANLWFFREIPPQDSHYEDTPTAKQIPDSLERTLLFKVLKNHQKKAKPEKDRNDKNFTKKTLHLTLLLLQDLQSNVYITYPDITGCRAARKLVYFGSSKAQPCSSKAADELSAPKSAFGQLPHGPD